MHTHLPIYQRHTQLWGWERIVLRYHHHWNLFGLVRPVRGLCVYMCTCVARLEDKQTGRSIIHIEE